jgi:hypothetical protein
MAEQFRCVLTHVNYLTKQKTNRKKSILDTKRALHFSIQFLFDTFFAPINTLRVTLEMRAQKRVSIIAVRV